MSSQTDGSKARRLREISRALGVPERQFLELVASPDIPLSASEQEAELLRLFRQLRHHDERAGCITFVRLAVAAQKGQSGV
ncbi:hypothetical protein [Methylobacterium fujisawaense]|uniref:hypothetical protein n=1 Tax=Methylobacterium fujisawaense TaxID=107400 RepID=UPI002F35BF18